MFVYSTLFGAGSAVYGSTTQATIFGIVWIASGAGLLKILKMLWH
jgi:hypothetical protein